MTQFLDALEEFKTSRQTRIALYRPSGSANDKLYHELMRALSKHGLVKQVDQYFLQSYEALLGGNLDILVVPELDALEVSLFRHLSDFIKGGGALIASGDDLLMRGKTFPFTHFGNEEIVPRPQYFFKRTVASLGIKPYVADIAPHQASMDTDFVIGAPQGLIRLALAPAGVNANTTSDRRRPFPGMGTQFVERYQVLRHYEVVTGHDACGRHINTPVTFTQNWETGARLCLFASNIEGSLLDDRTPHYADLIEASVRFCENRILATKCSPHFACYRQGEEVRIAYSVKNFSRSDAAFSVTLAITGNREVFFDTIEHAAAAGEEIEGEILWAPKLFDADYYHIRLRVIVGEFVVSKVDNAFVVWDEQVVAQGPRMEITDNDYIDVNGKRSVLTGANYYESHQAASMWVKPNIAKLNSDLEQMSKFGINFIRVHYHHPKWFYDHHLYEQGFVPREYEDLGKSPLPSEAQLRTYDAHIYLCQKHGIIYGGDIFTLRPSEMGDARGWMMVQDYMWLDDKLACQKQFLDLLVPRYLSVPGLTWDLFNEPFGVMDGTLPVFYEQFNAWARRLISHMRELGDTHTVTVGDNICINGFEPVSDYLSPHAFYRKAAGLKTKSKKPAVFQEAWMDRPSTPEGDQLQVGDMKLALTDTFRTGMAGFAPWQWTQQLAMWQAEHTYHGENWDDTLGCCVRGDATLKPSGRWYSDFIAMINDLVFLGYNAIEGANDGDADASKSGMEITLQALSADVARNAGGVISTDKGDLTIKSAPEVLPGEHYLILIEDGAVRRGIARKFSKSSTYQIAASVDCDIWFKFDRANRFALVKADGPCSLSISVSAPPTNIVLCDAAGNPTGVSAAFEMSDGAVSLTIESWQTYYWFKIEHWS